MKTIGHTRLGHSFILKQVLPIECKALDLIRQLFFFFFFFFPTINNMKHLFENVNLVDFFSLREIKLCQKL